MYLTRTLTAAALFSLLALGACKKKLVYPTLILPEATQVGNNTGGAKIDGQVWLPATTLFVGAPTRVMYHRGSTGYQLTVSLSRATDPESAPLNDTSIRIYVPDIRSAGTVALNQQSNPSLVNTPAHATFTYAKPSPDQVLITGPDAPGQLTVTRLDTVARVISGTFEFRAREIRGSATVQVTEGRFDLKY